MVGAEADPPFAGGIHHQDVFRLAARSLAEAVDRGGARQRFRPGAVEARDRRRPGHAEQGQFLHVLAHLVRVAPGPAGDDHIPHGERAALRAALLEEVEDQVAHAKAPLGWRADIACRAARARGMAW